METMRKVLGSKIHRATVTCSNLQYEGSITIPPPLLDAANISEYEAVQIWNVTAGTRFETYAIQGQPGSNAICVNGAAARLVAPGDIIIIACFIMIPESKLPGFRPRVVFVEADNSMLPGRKEVAGPLKAV
jgi:aspartate 1-decarboxylase